MSIEELQAENARLKAEVERLVSVSEAWKKRRLDKVETECINWAEVEKENARLKAKVERLTKAANEVAHAWSVYENGLIETPEWVKRSQVRDAISRFWNAAKQNPPHA